MLWLKLHLKKKEGGGHSELFGCLEHSTICMKSSGIGRGLPIGGGGGKMLDPHQLRLFGQFLDFSKSSSYGEPKLRSAVYLGYFRRGIKVFETGGNNLLTIICVIFVSSKTIKTESLDIARISSILWASFYNTDFFLFIFKYRLSLFCY